MRLSLRPILLPLAALSLASSCSLRTRSDPPRLEGDGILAGHLALGIAAEERLVHADIFGGHNDGSILEFGIWKLFRIELGILGASLSLGPVHAGLGVLAYDAPVPHMNQGEERRRKERSERKQRDKDQDQGVEGCAECEAARD